LENESNEEKDMVLIDVPEKANEENLEEKSVPTTEKRTKYIEIEVDSINEFDPGSQYISKSPWPLPYVIKTSGLNFCIDGYNYVTDAKSTGAEKIGVIAEDWETYSDYELAVRRFNIRDEHKTITYYIESMRQIYKLKKMYMESNEGVIEFGVGGNRKNLDDKLNLNLKLATDLNLNPDTVGKYLTDIRYLSNEAIEKFIEFQKKPVEEVGQYPGKDFFENVRPKKIKYIVELQSWNLKYGEIEEKVSEGVLSAYQEYRTEQPIKEFSDKLQKENDTMRKVAENLFSEIVPNPDPENSITEPEKPTPLVDVTILKGEPSIDDQMKALAEKIIQVIKEEKNKDIKKARCSELVIQLLKLIGLI